MKSIKTMRRPSSGSRTRQAGKTKGRQRGRKQSRYMRGRAKKSGAPPLSLEEMNESIALLTEYAPPLSTEEKLESARLRITEILHAGKSLNRLGLTREADRLKGISLPELVNVLRRQGQDVTMYE